MRATLHKVQTQYSSFLLWRKVYEGTQLGLFGEEIGVTEYKNRVISILYNKKLIEQDDKNIYLTFDLASLIKIREIDNVLEKVAFIILDDKNNFFEAYAFDLDVLITSRNVSFIGDGYAVISIEKGLV